MFSYLLAITLSYELVSDKKYTSDVQGSPDHQTPAHGPFCGTVEQLHCMQCTVTKERLPRLPPPPIRSRVTRRRRGHADATTMSKRRDILSSQTCITPSSSQAFESLTSSLVDEQNEENYAPIPLAVAETSLGINPRRPSMSILFFVCGLGSSLCYISILSSLVYFQSQYGDNSFVYLNLAVYLPLLPVSIVQARYDQLYDEHYGSASAFLFRGVVGYAICVGAMATVPLRTGLVWVCLHTFLIGSAGAVLQGLLFQMTAFVSSSVNRGGENSLKPAVAAGVQGSALLSLAVSVLMGFGSSVNDTRDQFKRFYLVVCLIEAVIFLLFIVLMKQSRVALSMVRRDSYFILADHEEEMDAGDTRVTMGESPGTIQDVSTNSTELSYRQLWCDTSHICACLFLTLVPSFLVGSWFTLVKTDIVMLPQILFYFRLGSDFFARLFSGFRSPSSVRQLLSLSVYRVFLVVAFFANASSDTFRYRNILSVALVATIAFGSGYLVTGCYQLAPSQLPEEAREQNATKQAALLNLAFSFSALLGVLSSLVLVRLEQHITVTN